MITALQWGRLGGLVAGTVLAASSFAQLTLTGTVTGTFSDGLTTYGGLSYTGSTFDITGAGPTGFYALGGNAGSPNFNNLGSFSLNTSAFNYSSPPATFTLDITFTSPTGIAGGNSTTYTADLVGDVVNASTGGVEIVFPSAPQSFTFTNSSGSGSFTLSVNDLGLAPGQTESASGFGTSSFTPNGGGGHVPAPGALACMGVGLIGSFLRRRSLSR